MKQIDGFLHSVPAAFLAAGLFLGIIAGTQIQIFNFPLNFAIVAVILTALILTNRYSKTLSAFIAIFIGLILQNSWQASMESGENYFSDGDSVLILANFYSAPAFRSEKEMTQLATISGGDYRIELIFSADLTQEILISGEQAKIKGVFHKFDTKNTAAPWEFDNIFQARIKNTVGEIEVVSIEKREKMPHIVKIYKHIRKKFEESRYNSLYVSLFTGDRSFLTPYVSAFFKESGLVHFLSISGLHIAILIVAVSTIIWILPLPILARRGIIAIFILYLPFLVGFYPATLRAVIMGILLTVSPLFNRKNNSINSLFVTFFVILAVYPMHVFLTGFQYSFSATFAVLILPKLVGEQKYKNEIIFFTMPVFLFLATAPVQIFHFATLTSPSIIANLTMLPVLTIICQATLVSIFVPFEFISNFILFLCDNLLDIVFFTINKFVILSGFAEEYTQISPFVFIAATIIIILLRLFPKRGLIYSIYLVLAFITASLLFNLYKKDTVYTVSSQNFRMKVYSGKNSSAVILGDAQTKNYYNPSFLRWLNTRLSGGFSKPVIFTDDSYVPQDVFKDYTHIVLRNTTGEIKFEGEPAEQITAPIAVEEKKHRKVATVKKYEKRRIVR